MEETKLNQLDTIVVMGNGPSLKNINFEDLRDVDTFGMNLAYRHWEKIDWWPTYHGCFDYVVTDNHIKEFSKLVDNPKSLIKKHFFIRNFTNSEKVKFIRFKDQQIGSFTTNIDNFGFGGNTGVNCCQVAVCLGYKKIILVGVDCKYVQIVDQAELINGRLQMKETPDNNPNYFFNDYNRSGDVYNVPNEEIYHRPAWHKFADFAKANNIDVVNCSPKSELGCFRRGNINEELK